MRCVYCSDGGLFSEFLECIVNQSWSAGDVVSKGELKDRFRIFLGQKNADWALEFLFFREIKGDTYDKTIGTILTIIDRLSDAVKYDGTNLIFLDDISIDAYIPFKDDAMMWSYVISALCSGNILGHKEKMEIFNIGRGLFYRSLNFINTTTEGSRYLIWQSNQAFTISQKNKRFHIEFFEEYAGEVYENLEWLLEPHTKNNPSPFEEDFSLLYQARLEFLSPESMLYFWQLMSRLGFVPKQQTGTGILLSTGEGLTTGIEYSLDPRGQLFDGTCLSVSFEVVCDHLTHPLPAYRRDIVREHSITPNHSIENFGLPLNTKHLDGTMINWNQGMMHSAILGQTPRMWLLSESFGFSIALHSPYEEHLKQVPMTLPWYKYAEPRDFSDRYVELGGTIDDWKQRLLQVLLRGNLPIICIDSDDYGRAFQNGMYIWTNGDEAQRREKKMKQICDEQRHRNHPPFNRHEEGRVGHALTITGVHLLKSKRDGPVLLWKVLDSNPGHNFIAQTSDLTGLKFDSGYSNAREPCGGDTLWCTSSELFSQLDKGDVWIHEIGWAPLNVLNQCPHTAEYRPLTNLIFKRETAKLID